MMGHELEHGRLSFPKSSGLFRSTANTSTAPILASWFKCGGEWFELLVDPGEQVSVWLVVEIPAVTKVDWKQDIVAEGQ